MRRIFPMMALAAALLAARPGRAQQDELVVAVYLPGTHFPQLATKVALGGELAEHLGASLGRKAVSRVYATADALEGDKGRITVALVEAPYIAARLNMLTPLCVATSGASSETRLLVMAGAAVPEAAALRQHRLAFAQIGQGEQSFLENFLFEGVLPLSRERLQPARDAASALSLITVRKADAVVLYEGDEAQGRQAGLQAIYRSVPLPRPTLVVFDDSSPDAAQVGKLREVMARFSGRAYPPIGSFRAATPDRYLALFGQMQRRAQHLPPLLSLSREGPPLRLPVPIPPALPRPPLTVYAPPLPLP